MKILIVASAFSHIRNFHLPYLKAMKEQGHRVEIACGGEILELPYVDAAHVLPFSKSITSSRNLAAIGALRTLLREGHYDLLITHATLASAVGRLAVPHFGRRIKVITVVHGYLFDDASSALKRLLYGMVEKLLAPRTDILVTMNAYDDRYARRHRLAKRIVCVDGMGIDTARLHKGPREERERIRACYGVAESDFLFVYAAELSARKSQDVLLRAMTKLPPNVKLILAGKGQTEQQLRSNCRACALEGRVIFAGYVADIPSLYTAADAIVSSSRSEGLPFNIMEAMFLSRPVVASAVKGHSDLITDGKTGLLYPYGDADGCAAAMARLARDPALGRTLAANAVQSVQRYALPLVLPRVLEAYELDKKGK